jgi:hypothetical protein
MQTLDAEEELSRLFDDGQSMRFVRLKMIREAYPDLEVFGDGVRRFNSIASLNDGVDSFETKIGDDGAPVLVYTFVSMIEGRVYSNPPCHVVGHSIPRGFGVEPRVGWREELAELGIRSDLVGKIQDFLTKNPPISYALSD